MFNVFRNVRNSSKVDGIITFKQFQKKLMGENIEHQEQVQNARNYLMEGNKLIFDSIKKDVLECATLNFTFNEYRRNNRIKQSTGFIYLDVDNSFEINLTHPLIHFSWISTSGNGRGIMVKATDIIPETFKENYVLIGQELGVEVDLQAAKPSQLTVISYDPNPYFNGQSTTWYGTQKKEKVCYSPYKKNHNTIGSVKNLFENKKIRFNNLDEFVQTLNFEGKPVLALEKKVGLSQVFVPETIAKGQRNNTLVAIIYQIRALNPSIIFEVLLKLGVSINKRCFPRYPYEDLLKIINYVYKIPITELIPKKNYYRRIFFNPYYSIDIRRKRSLGMKVINQERTRKVLKKIEEAINNWSYPQDGKPTQLNMARKSGVSLSTVKKYYPLFKEVIQKLNDDFKPP